MADGVEGFIGRCDVVEPRRGNRRWPDHVKAQIVAESYQPGVRVADVARRHGLIPHQVSDWRRHARQGLLPLPCDVQDVALPGFVPLAIVPELVASTPAPASGAAVGVMSVELGADVVVRIAGDVPVERAVAMVQGLRGVR